MDYIELLRLYGNIFINKLMNAGNMGHEFVMQLQR